MRDRTDSFSGVFAGLAVIDLVLLAAVFLMRRPQPLATHAIDPLPVAG